jgi:hypothetical protein
MGWYCNFCGNFYGATIPCYHCPACHFDCCTKCYDTITTKKPKVTLHQHHLLNLQRDSLMWTCGGCSKSFMGCMEKWSCGENCNFHVCTNCYFA